MTGRTIAGLAAGLIVCALAWSQEGVAQRVEAMVMEVETDERGRTTHTH